MTYVCSKMRLGPILTVRFVRFVFLALLVLLVLSGCLDRRDSSNDNPLRAPGLSDTLVTIFEAMVSAATTDRSDQFKDFLARSEIDRLERIQSGYGSVSLDWCLERQLGSWPDLDTLVFEDLVHRPPYARVAFTGAGAYARFDDRVRYTFLLFHRNDQGDGWRVAGVSSLEKDRFDRYGTELSYLETELPSQLRFPRHF